MDNLSTKIRPPRSTGYLLILPSIPCILIYPSLQTLHNFTCEHYCEPRNNTPIRPEYKNQYTYPQSRSRTPHGRSNALKVTIVLWKASTINLNCPNHPHNPSLTIQSSRNRSNEVTGFFCLFVFYLIIPPIKYIFNTHYIS